MFRLSITDEKWFGVVKALIALAISLLITFVALVITTENPVHAFVTLLTAPITKVRYFGNVLEAMTPLVFTALACSILFRCGMLNLGVGGIFYISGIATTYIATQVVIQNGFLHPVIAILGSGIFGGILMMIPGFLKAKFNTNIIVSTLMLESIYLGIGSWLIKGSLSADDISIIASPLFAQTAKLNYIIPGTRITVGFCLAALAAVGMYILINKTKLGYQIRISGQNPNFAKYSGIAAFALILLVHFISGFLAGVGSSVELLSYHDRFTWSVIPKHGATGILLAMMGENKVIPVMVATFGISYLKIGAEIMSRSTAAPVEIISIIEATLVLLISSQYFLRGLRERRLMKEGLGNA